MTEIKWQEPPSVEREAGKWRPVFTELRKHPGRWALVYHGSQAMASAFKRGRFAGAEPGEFDAVARGATDGKHDIYLRFVGEGGEHA